MGFQRAALVALACALGAAGLTVIPDAARTPAAADPPTGGTTIVAETFTGTTVADPAWTVQNATCLTGATTAPPAGAAQIPTCATRRVGDVPPIGTPGYLQLTDESGNAVGSVLYNRPVPASAGVSITFDQFQYGGNGADGIGFFLVDGATNLTRAGANGGSLGYAQRNSEPGILGGILGVGLDSYGNFYDDGEGRGAGCPAGQRSPSTIFGAVAPNVITVRGPGSGATGYCYLASTTPPIPPANPNKPGTSLNGGTGTLRAATLTASWRQVNIQVTPAPNPRVIVQVRYHPDVTGDPWITELNVTAPAGLPTTYKFGLSASTGGSNDVHLIRNALVQSINPLANLQLEKQVDRTAGNLPAIITAGTVIPYQYTVTNAGLETLSTLAVTDDKITGPISCDRTTLAPAPAAGSTSVCRGTYTVTAADVTAGQVVNTATAAARDPGNSPVTSPQSTVTVALVSRLGLTKTVQTPPPYSPGQQVQYSYTVTNTGGSTLTNVAVTDDRISSANLICQANTLAPGASTTCTGTYTVNLIHANGAGNIVNTARATGITPIGQAVQSPQAQASIPVNTDIAVTKTVDNPTPDVGDTVTFTVTATNNGPAAATGAVVTDLLPAGRLTLLTASTAGPQASTYTASTGAWSLPALAVGNTLTLTITARVDTNTAVSNSAALTKLTQVDINAANNTATATLNPVVPVLDLAVTKQVIGAATVPAGQPVTFRVTVTNNGPRPGTGITVADALPPGLDYRPGPSGGTGGYDPGTNTWTVGSLAVGGTASFDFVLGTTDTGTFTNVATLATVTPADSDTSNNSASDTVTVRTPVADLAIIKGVFPQQAVVGDTVTYQVDVTNLGPDPVPGVYVKEVGVEGVTVLDATPSQGTVSIADRRWDVGTLAAGATAHLTVTARLDTAGTKVNVATVDAARLLDPEPTNNESTATVTTLGPAVDVSVAKSVARLGGGPVNGIPLGQDAVFTITATNNPVDGAPATTATNVVFSDVIDAGMTFVSSTGDGTFDPATGQWSVASIPVGATVTRTIRVTGTIVGQHTNTLALTSLDQRDTDPTNHSASATAVFVELADLEVTKSVDQPVAQPGDTVTYTITVTNHGPNATDDTLTNDPAIIVATIAGHTVDNGTFDEGTRTWTIPHLAANETATLTVDILISSAASGNYHNLVAIQQSRVTDPDPSNNTASAELFVPAADIAVSKRVDQPDAVLGDTVTFTVGVRNLGPATGDDVRVRDLLPAGLAYVSSSASVGAYDPATGIWAIGSLDPADLPATRDQAVLRVTARVTRLSALTNTATADRSSAFPYDPRPGNNTDSATIRGAAPAPPRLETRTSRHRVAPGHRLWDRVTVTGLARNTTVPATARLYGPFASRAAANCRPANLAHAVTWKVSRGSNRSPSVRVAAPGIYTWQVTTRATADAGAASHRCGLRSETTTVAKPGYVAPVVDGGFSGTLLAPSYARVALPIIRAPGFGLVAAALTTGVATGRMDLPDNVGVTARLRKSAGYGDKIGTTVVAGHVSDRHDRPGALYHLSHAHPGDVVTVARGATTYRYRVTGKATFDRTRRLPHRYFTTTGPPRLVLISCTARVAYPNGHFHYTRYQVVSAKFIKATTTRR